MPILNPINVSLIKLSLIVYIAFSLGGCTKRGAGGTTTASPTPLIQPSPTPTLLVQPPQPDRISLGGSATLLVGECKAYTVQSLKGDVLTVVLENLNLNLEISGAATSYSDSNCTAPLTTLRILAQTSSTRFYLRSIQTGANTLGVSSPTLGNTQLIVNVLGTANLVLGPTSQFDFGWKAVGLEYPQVFVLSNLGTGSLTGLSASQLSGNGFVFTGGSFPGTGGNCSDSILPSQNCSVSVSFLPLISGTFNGSVLFPYLDSSGSHSTTLLLTGIGASGGALDPTFNSTGKVFTQIGNSTDEIRSLKLGLEGKFLATGSTLVGANTRFALARYLSNGSLDATFGNGGQKIYAISGGASYPFASLIQNDQKIVVLGYQYKANKYDSAMVRFLTNGDVDTGFADNGESVVPVSSGYDIWTAGVLQTDGKIIAAGYTQNATFDFSVARFNSNGSLDSNFGTTGIVSVGIGTSSELVSDVTLQSDGKLLVAGSSINGNGNYDFAIARLLTQGVLDTSFGNQGKLSIDFFGATDNITAIKTQSDGKIVAVGSAVQNSSSLFAMLRLNTDGSLDTAFNSNGKFSRSFSDNDDIRSFAISVDQKYLVGGTATTNSKNDFLLFRMNGNGSLDTGFGTVGYLKSSLSQGMDKLFSLFLLNDDRIVAAGSSKENNITQFAIARYFP